MTETIFLNVCYYSGVHIVPVESDDNDILIVLNEYL